MAHIEDSFTHSSPYMGYLIPLYPAKDRYEYSRYPVYVRRRPDMAHEKQRQFGCPSIIRRFLKRWGIR